MLVGLRFRNEEPSEYLEFEHHNFAALLLHQPVVRTFSRIGNKFNFTRFPMQEHTIALSDFLT